MRWRLPVTPMRFLLTLICLLLALPVLGVLAAWLAFDADAWAVLAHQARTVLAGYALQSLLLAVFVAVGVALLGGGAAAAVALFEFPGRRAFEWALLLPMAMPAYVLAYAYTDFLQYSGTLQTALRAVTGSEGALWPDVRSLPGAVVLFVLCLYPYVYLLVRTALAERGVQMMEAARLLGAGLWRRIGEVALPLSRPALVAGVALALMETLADYGVGAYFGLTTFSTGIYKAWLVMNDRIAAAQLASLLLAMVALLLWAERRARRHLRFAASRGTAGQGGGNEARPVVLHGRLALLAWSLCALPVAFGFVLPLLLLARLVWHEARWGEVGLPLARFARWCLTSFELAASAALLAAALSLALAFALRLAASRTDRSATTRMLTGRRAHGVAGLCAAGRGDCRRHPAAAGRAAGALARGTAAGTRHRHGGRACCMPTWCGSRRWHCNRSRPATRGCRPAWTTAPACSAPRGRGCWVSSTCRCCGVRCWRPRCWCSSM